MDHYRTDKEGHDRMENLEELINAAESFVTAGRLWQGCRGPAAG